MFLAASLFYLSSCGTPPPPEAEQLEDFGFSVLGGDTPPDISFYDSTGETRSLSEFEGSVVLLNFWATWCPPCRAEIPDFNSLYKELGDKDFSFIAVNVQEDESVVTAFADEFNVEFPLFFDPEAQAARNFGVAALPTTVLIDRDGSAVAVIQGAFEWSDPDFVSMMRDWVN